MKKYYKYIIYILIIIIALFLDLLTKHIVESNIALGSSVNVLGNFLKFTFIHNTGAAFGIFSGKLIMLIAFSVVVICFIVYQFYEYRNSKFICSSFALLLGGLLGNLFDRVYFGYVRDFIDFTIFKYDAPIFNISDIFIVCSIFLIIIGISKYEIAVESEVKKTNEDSSKRRTKGEKIRPSSFRKVREDKK